MIPQILQQLGGGLKIPPQVKQLISAIKCSGNPQAMLNQLMQTNPAMKQVMEIVQQYGGDTNRAVCDIARKNGIDPQEIMDLLK